MRGGSVVSDAEFRQRLPPIEGPINSVAQLRRTGQRPVPVAVGLLAPDKLGLHDMLGNVAEMVAEPYRLTRGGRSGATRPKWELRSAGRRPRPHRTVARDPGARAGGRRGSAPAAHAVGQY